MALEKTIAVLEKVIQWRFGDIVDSLDTPEVSNVLTTFFAER